MNVYFDFESKSGAEAPDLRKCGAYRYANHATALILSYAIDDGPVRVVHNNGAPLCWADLPELHDIFDAATFIAWNAGFDRAIWNYALLDSPFLAPEKARDAMAAALANNLPPDLERASTTLTGSGKMKDGKRLIGRFCAHDSAPIETDEDREDWIKFVTYAAIDTKRLRDNWKRLRPLPDEEWAVYVANEAVNDLGIPIDLVYVEKAAALAAQDLGRTNARLAEITGGDVISVYEHARIASWVYNRLDDPEAREILVTYTADAETEEFEGEAEEAPKQTTVLSCRRTNVVRLLDYLQSKGGADPALIEVLQLREFGAGSAPKKFKAILDQHIGGRLYGQFLFNGAHSGRFSGKGVQPQNLTRSILGESKDDDYGKFEAPTVDLIADGCDLETLAAHGLGEPPAKKLALVVRPAVMAPIGRTLVKADYSQIEARVLPFLTGGTIDSMPLLAAFQRSDTDPTAPDLYRVTAAAMLHKRAEDIGTAERQRGKVAILACGFQGGKNALMSMATNYGMYLSPAEAQIIVDQWRAANLWADKLWGKHSKDVSYGLYGAACRAVQAPGSGQRAGRILFTFAKNYLGGSLLMMLPSGRIMTYPWCKFRDYEIKDKVTKAVVDVRHGLTFRRTSGIVALYGGRFAENATQAAAADLLRDSIVEARSQGLPLVMHAHDELVIEPEESEAEEMTARLESIMKRERPWTAGLPLAVDLTERFYYSACKVPKKRLALPSQAVSFAKQPGENHVVATQA